MKTGRDVAEDRPLGVLESTRTAVTGPAAPQPEGPHQKRRTRKKRPHQLRLRRGGLVVEVVEVVRQTAVVAHVLCV
eukprot:GDKH01011776.1.p3 GENE.GDKH01011776.1~~GDKH01011776.1.p3  ORF type:complete len:76 (-),score=9.71 GDKH01011776.1:19-246(-)